MSSVAHAMRLRRLGEDLSLARSGILHATSALYGTLNHLAPRDIVPNLPSLVAGGKEYRLSLISPDGQSYTFTEVGGATTMRLSAQAFLRHFGPDAGGQKRLRPGLQGWRPHA